ALERSANADLRLNVAELSASLQSSTTERDDLARRLSIVTQERDQLAASLAEAQSTGAGVDEKLEDAYRVIEADRARVQALLDDIAVLESLRDELVRKLRDAEAQSEAEQQRAAQLEQEVARLTEENERT